MRVHLVLAAAASVVLTAAAPVHAQGRSDDRTAYRAIAASDLQTAERHLVAERRIYPGRPELMLNLAAVYARTNRLAEARALYADVLGRPAVDMDLASGKVVSSHRIAEQGRAMLDRGTAMAAR
jgi:hypothetical protein